MSFDRKAVWSRARGWLAAVLLVTGFAIANAPVRAASFQPLEIVTRNGVQVFSVEMATTEEEKQTGLMYRKELADGKGMLFDFNPEQEVSMWMKNTYISLDMIFIRADGRILRIAENTEPLSTKIISSQGLARGCSGGAGGHGTEVRHPTRRPRRPPAVRQQIEPFGGANASLAGAPGSVYRRGSLDMRGIAQPGSAAVLGTAGRWFESSCPDQQFQAMIRQTAIRKVSAWRPGRWRGPFDRT